MALPSLTLRNVKGSPITFAEMDTNLTNLQQADFNVSVGASVSPIRFDSTLTFTGGAGISIALNTSTRTLTFTNTGTVSAGTGLSQVGTTVSLNTATTSTIGGVRVGANLSITADGTLSATGGGFTGTVAILTATQAVFINGIQLARTGNNLDVTLTSSTTTSVAGVTTGTLFQARFENNLADDAKAANTGTNNGTVAFTTASRFSSYSLDFGQDASQTAKNITFSNTNNLNFGTTAFTVEAWAYCAERNIQAPNYYHKIVQTSSTQKWLAFTDSNDSESFGWFWGDENNSVFIAMAGVPFIYNQWNHVVMMRSGNNLWLGTNGNMERVLTNYTHAIDWTNFKVGGNQSVGWIDSVRISTGTIYSTSTTYTVPTAEFAFSSTQTVITTSSALPFLPLAGGVMLGDVTLDGVRETVVNHGNVSGTITPNASSGTVHKMTLTGNITLNALTNVATGTNMTIIMTQDSTGTRTLTNTGWKWLGGNKTLSTTGTNIDIVTIFYDGGTYYASLGKGYA